MATEPAYERPVTPAPPAEVPRMPRRAWGGLAARIAVTLLGAAGLIVGAFLAWIRSPITVKGTDLSAKVLWTTGARATTTFTATVGFVSIVLGLVALVGLAFRTGWLTRLAGALGIVAFALLAITLVRAPGVHFPQAVGAGAWLALAGSVVALIGGFLGARFTRYTTSPPGTTTTVTS